MSNQSSYRIAAATCAVVGLLGMAVQPAAAQTVLQTPTAIPGIGVVAGPPVAFNAATASVTAMTQYAVPPEPDAAAAPEAHAAWSRAMTGFQNRTVTVLQATGISNGPKKPVGSMARLSNGAVSATSSNWSGTSVIGGTFSKYESIIGEFVVPTAHQAIGACTGGWDYSSQWPGIDGNGSDDVLQGGAEVDAYCNNGSVSSYYSAWVEWYPYNETRVSSPTVHPGDLLYVQVWSTSTTTGYVYFYNYSTGNSAEYSMTAPSGTTLQSDSVEWIVERPGVNGGLATLTNYIDTAWPSGYAWNYKAAKPAYYYQGATPSAGTLELITMLDNNNSGISAPTIENSKFLWFKDFGSAY